MWQTEKDMNRSNGSGSRLYATLFAFAFMHMWHYAPLRRHLSLNQNGLANDFELRCGKWFWPRKSTRRLWQNALRLGSQLVSRGAPSIMNFNGNQLYFNCCCPCCPKNSWFSCVARRRILSFAILSLLMSCYHAIMTWPMMRIIERHWFFYDSLIWTE